MYYAEGWRGSQIIIALYSYFFIALIMANIWAIKKIRWLSQGKARKRSCHATSSFLAQQKSFN